LNNFIHRETVEVQYKQRAIQQQTIALNRIKSVESYRNAVNDVQFFSRTNCERQQARYHDVTSWCYTFYVWRNMWRRLRCVKWGWLRIIALEVSSFHRIES